MTITRRQLTFEVKVFHLVDVVKNTARLLRSDGILAPHFLVKSYKKSRARDGNNLKLGLENFNKVARGLIIFVSYFSFFE